MVRMRAQAELLSAQPTVPRCSSHQPAVATNRGTSLAAMQGDKCHVMTQEVL